MARSERADRPQPPPSTLLTASLQGFESALAHLGGGGAIRKLTPRSLGVTEAVGHQVHRTLSMLQLIGHDGSATPGLMKLLRGDNSILEAALEKLYPDLVRAIRDARPASEVFSQFDGLGASVDVEGRFRTLLLGLLARSGLEVEAYRRRPRSDSPRRADAEKPPPQPPDSSSSEPSALVGERIAEQQAALYLRGLDDAIAEGDMKRVATYHRLLAEVTTTLHRRSARVSEPDEPEPGD